MSRSSKFAPRTMDDFVADAKELMAKIKTGRASSADIETFVASHHLAGPAWREAQAEIEVVWRERVESGS